jgi:hypothetical protein
MTKRLFRSLTIALLFVSIVILPGCGKTAKNQFFVVVLDLTASTDPEGRAVAFEAMQAWFSQKRVHRGDMMVIIPITNDALTQTQGNVLRFQVSERREAYDEDMRILASQVKDSLNRMEEKAAQNPYLYSDVLGALRLASEELTRQRCTCHKTLIVLSDFIQDDKQANFKITPELNNNRTAELYARQLAAAHPFHLDAQVVYLGWLRSKDLTNMASSRRDALEAFWDEYFRGQGVPELVKATDGPGGLERVMDMAD